MDCLTDERRGRHRSMAQISYRCHHFLPLVIQHAVWLYLRFTLRYRDVEDCACGDRDGQADILWVSLT
jgi:hypothetical protein